MPHHAATATEDPRLRIVAYRRICASLLLQQFNYYQIWYDFAWITFWFGWLCYTYWQGLRLHDDDVVRTVFMIFWLLAEPVRLAAGWYGNLQENVPWLALYVILSVMPLQGTIFYMLVWSFDMNKWSRAVQVTQAILLELELVTGLWVVARLGKEQKKQYYLFEFAMGQRRKINATHPQLDQPGRAGAATTATR